MSFEQEVRRLLCDKAIGILGTLEGKPIFTPQGNKLVAAILLSHEAEVKKARIDELEQLNLFSSGGGSWRRNIALRLAKLKEPESK